MLKIRTSNEEFYRCYRQAIEDMAALRLPIAGTDHMVFVPAAGLPWFMAPFGRDSLIVSLQNILIYPEFARGALDVLGRWQAKERDDYRDAEPGKIMHELRYGELAHFKLIPHTPYYGTADATPLYLITLHAAWRATGDHALLEAHLDTAEGCLSWIDDCGDRDGDGFQEYQTRSPAGYENMSWKDAGDSMNYADGTPVKGPKAVCELQGYVYDAWLRMAEIYDELGRTDRAAALRDKAATLFRRFNDAFWDEESGFYAFMLDGEKRQVLSVASNPGPSAVVGHRAARSRRARRVAPVGTGHELGLGHPHAVGGPSGVQSVLLSERLGLAARQRPDRARLQALRLRARGRRRSPATSRVPPSHFLLNQLPELYSGMQRGDADFPVQYLGANVPQAWAAGSVFSLLQAILGITLDAPRGRIFVDPALPAWLPDITLLDLRLGRRSFDIRFWRDDATTRFEVLRGPAQIVEQRRFHPVAAPA